MPGFGVDGKKAFRKRLNKERHRIEIKSGRGPDAGQRVKQL